MNEDPKMPVQVSPHANTDEPRRVVHVSIRGPKTWLGKLAFAIVAIATLLLALLFSIVVFAVVASVALVAFLYFLWATRGVRRALREAHKEQQRRNVV